MNKHIFVYPKLSSTLLKNLSYSHEDFFSTEIKIIKSPLRAEPANDDKSVVVLKDKNNNPWSLIDSNLIIDRIMEINNPAILFGKEGVACKSATVGIAIRWFSQESRQRGIYDIGSININTKSSKLKYRLKFDTSSLSTNLSLQTIIFLKEAGCPDNEESFLCNKQGLVLGELDSLTIRLDGKGSEFPIFIDENKKATHPLWTVNMDWNDPSSDPFVDCFQIYLNNKNINYKYLDRNSVSFDEYLMNEIVSSALTMLILKLKEEPDSWDRMVKNNELESGSISQVINYFINVLNMDFDTPLSIHTSFRQYFETRGV